MEPPLIEGLNPLYIVLAVLFAAGMLLAAVQILNIRRRQARSRVVTEIECPHCSYHATREFRRGDYIGMKTRCPSCGGDAYVIRIYQESTGKEKP